MKYLSLIIVLMYFNLQSQSYLNHSNYLIQLRQKALKHNLKTISVYTFHKKITDSIQTSYSTYDQNGNLLEYTDNSHIGATQYNSKSYYFYNNKNQRIIELEKSVDTEEYLKLYKYTYKENGLIQSIKKRVTKKDTILYKELGDMYSITDSLKHCKWDSLNRLIEYSNFLYQEFKRYSYNNDNSLKKITYHNINKQTWMTEYYENNLLIEAEALHPNSKKKRFWYKYKIIYNTEKLKSQQINFDKKGKITYTDKYYYTYYNE